MKAVTLLLAFQTLSIVCFSQVTGTVLDKGTRQPVPYANIALEGNSFGTTSDLNGFFIIPETYVDGRIVVSAIGYVTAFIHLADKNLEIVLEPRIYDIESVVVKPRKGNRELQVDKLNRQSDNSLACNGYAWISAKYFEYKPEYDEVPFVKQINILTRSAIGSAKFNIRLLAANEDGEPYQEILNENLIAKSRRGKRVVTVNLSDKNIRFSENGLFVALEWLIVDENKHEYSYTLDGKWGKQKEVHYQPDFATYVKLGESRTWGYHGGQWHKMSYTPQLGKNSYFDLAIELVLTD